MMIHVSLADFSFDVYSITTIAVLGTMLTVLFIMMIYDLWNNYLDKKRRSDINLNESNVRIYTINFYNKTIRFFDKSNMSKQRVTSLDIFLAEYNSLDRERIEMWINSYVEDKENKTNFLTVPVRLDSTKKSCLSVYRITSYNKEKKLLHFENTLLPGISAKMNAKSNTNFIKKLDDVVALTKSGRKKYNQQCTILYIKLVLQVENNQINPSSRYESGTVSLTSIYEPLDSIYRFLNKKRYLSFANDAEAVLFDFEAEQKSDILTLCNTVFDEISRFISIKALSKVYSVAIGCSSRNTENHELIETCLSKAKNMCFVAERKNNKKIAIFGVDSVAVSKTSSNSSQDISSLIKNKTFKAYFTPILSINPMEKMYYLLDLNPFGTSFQNMEEVYYHAKSNYRLVELLQIELNELNRLFEHYPLANGLLNFSIRYAPDLVEAFKSYPILKERLILAFDKSEVEDLYEADYGIEEVLNLLEEQKVEFCLNVVDTAINVPKEIMNKFSLFVVSIRKNNNDEKHELSSYISTRSILASYGKEIIVNELEDKSDIELLYNLGYSYFVCKSVSGTSSAPYIPEEKWKEIIKKDDENNEE